MSKEVLPLPVRRTCERCLWWIGGFCRNSESPRVNLRTGAACKCDLWKYRKKQTRKSVAPCRRSTKE